MYIAYVDETGDAGVDVNNGASPYYCLGVALVRVADWDHAQNSLIKLRREIKIKHGVPIRSEVKASHLIRNGGWFSGSGVKPWHRREIFKQHLSALEPAKIQAFAVYLQKSDFDDLSKPEAIRVRAWEYLFQRLSKTFAEQPLFLVHDEGDDKLIRGVARKASRILSSGSATSNAQIALPTIKIIDDPIPRNSNNSYFLQVADLIAYSASKAMSAPSKKISKICPQSTWMNLGGACLAVVNQYRRSRSPKIPPGIITQK